MGNVTYCARAEVDGDGHVVAVDGRVGTDLLAAHPEIVDHARAMLKARVSEVRYAWECTPGDWFLVLARRIDRSTNSVCSLELRRGAPPYRLTPRELDVLTLAAGGLCNAEISQRLGAATKTVAKHMESILEKLDQPGRAGATAVAVEQGLMRIPVPGGGRSLEGLSVGVLDQFLNGRTTIPPRLRQRRLPHGPRPIRIGSVLSTADGTSSDFVQHRNGAQLAVAELNARGGVGGRPVELVVSEVDVHSPTDVRVGLEHLFSADVDALCVPYLYPAIESCTLAAEHGAPYLHSSASSAMVDLVREGPSTFKQTFQVCPTDDYYGQAFVAALVACERSGRWSPPNRRIALVETDMPDSLRVISDRTFRYAEKAGWEIDVCSVVSGADTDWSDALAAVRSSAPAAVLYTHDFPAVAATFLREFSENPTPTLLFAAYSPSIPKFLDTAGLVAAEGLIWLTVTGVYDDPVGRRFRDAYLERYGAAAGLSQAGIGYDQVALLARAWSTTGNPRAFDRVSDALRETVHRGVNGGYWFGEAGQHALGYPFDVSDPSFGQANLAYQVQDGQHRLIPPSPWSTNEFRLPAWVR